MTDISFDKDNKGRFPTRYHGEVTLSKAKWDLICSQPERYYYKHNGEKVATTLVNPDYVRHHKEFGNQFLYYKRFESFKLGPNIEGPQKFKFFTVVIDTNTKKICTVYPVREPKKGKEYLPR